MPIAAALGKFDEAAAWLSESHKQYKILTETLWDGDRFKCVNTMTGETGTPEGLLGLMPLILGRRLPGEMRDVLAQTASKTDWGTAPVIPATLVILGLKDAGLDTAAKTAAEALLRSCVVGGANDARGKGVTAGTFYHPAACAALLALGSRVLQ